MSKLVFPNLWWMDCCSKIKKMHDHAVLDIVELTLFSEKALLLLIMLLLL